MLISVITPTFNSEKTIERNIKSIIKQNYNNFEHIIIDNLSRDRTLDIVKRIYEENNIISKLRIISEKDEGISDAFNKGIRIAKGKIIAILNSDDYYFDYTVFERVADAFNDSNILFTHGNLQFIDNVYGSNIRKPLLCDITKAMPYNHPTIFLRKTMYEEYGFFDTSYNYAMDFELFCRIEKTINNFRNRGKYLAGKPIAVQLAGGKSWQNEVSSIKEVKKALIKHQLWNNKAKTYYRQRIIRTKLKKILHFIGFRYLVILWRKRKWEN
jgi:glycosyltransferase involved in cell wall biosynthesis